MKPINQMSVSSSTGLLTNMLQIRLIDLKHHINVRLVNDVWTLMSQKETRMLKLCQCKRPWLKHLSLMYTISGCVM